MGMVVRVSFFEELADDGAFEKGFVRILEGGDEASGVEVDERLRFVVLKSLGLISVRISG